MFPFSSVQKCKRRARLVSQKKPLLNQNVCVLVFLPGVHSVHCTEKGNQFHTEKPQKDPKMVLFFPQRKNFESRLISENCHRHSQYLIQPIMLNECWNNSEQGSGTRGSPLIHVYNVTGPGVANRPLCASRRTLISCTSQRGLSLKLIGENYIHSSRRKGSFG